MCIHSCLLECTLGFAVPDHDTRRTVKAHHVLKVLITCVSIWKQSLVIPKATWRCSIPEKQDPFHLI